MVYARYITTNVINSLFSISKPIFIVEGTNYTTINEIDNIGYYNFTIKNYNETDTSQTPFTYSIEIISNLKDSLKFELYKDDILIPLTNLKTQPIFLEANTRTEHIFKLKIIYEGSLTQDNKNISEEVQIRVYSEQERGQI